MRIVIQDAQVLHSVLYWRMTHCGNAGQPSGNCEHTINHCGCEPSGTSTLGSNYSRSELMRIATTTYPASQVRLATEVASRSYCALFAICL